MTSKTKDLRCTGGNTQAQLTTNEKRPRQKPPRATAGSAVVLPSMMIRTSPYSLLLNRFDGVVQSADPSSSLESGWSA